MPGIENLELHEWIDKAYPALNRGDKPLAEHLKYHQEIQGLMKGKA